MAKDYEVVRMTDPLDGDAYIHLPGVDCYATLCGWCDVPGSKTDNASDIGPVNCHNCLEVLKEARRYSRAMIKT